MNKVTSATALLLGLILSLPAMAQNPNFTVTGTVKDMEGVVITMYDYATRQTMDSIVVSDNKFQLQGRADSAMMVGLYSSDYSMYADLLVMPGSQMVVDKENIFSTTSTDIFNNLTVNAIKINSIKFLDGRITDSICTFRSTFHNKWQLRFHRSGINSYRRPSG